MNISVYDMKDKDSWNAFIRAQRPNTFLQSWEWGEVQQSDGEDIARVGFFEGDQQIGAAQLITVHARRGVFALCPHGPIFRSEHEAIEYLPNVIRALTDRARRAGAVALRIAPLVEDSARSRNVFAGLGFRPAPLHMHAELTWVLDITPAEDELLAGMRKSTRHAVRKAQREGVTVDISDAPADIERFWPIYEATTHRHGFVPFPRSLIEAQARIFASEKRMFFAFARHNGQDVAAALLPHFGDTVFYYHGASVDMPSGVPAAQLLQWEAIREARRREATRYNFWGIAPQDEPDHPFAGITKFKTGFGGQAIDYLHAQDLPLSWKYVSLWAVDTWRKWRRGF